VPVIALRLLIYMCPGEMGHGDMGNGEMGNGHVDPHRLRHDRQASKYNLGLL